MTGRHATMTEHPVFIPSDGEYIGATLTVPAGEARALVVMLTGGGGVPRSHRFGLWTKVARGMAARGIASLRMEWPGTGDSTGTHFFTFDGIPVGHVLRAAEFGLAATGIRRLGIFGNCGGARAALQAAQHLPACESIVTIFLQPLGGSGVPGMKAERVERILPAFRRLPAPLQHAVVRSYFAFRRAYLRLVLARKPGQGFMDDLRRLHRSADILLLESNTELAGGLPKLVRGLQDKARGRRIEIDYLPGTTMQQFETPEEQALVVNHAVAWFSTTFGDGGLAAPGPEGVLQPVAVP